MDASNPIDLERSEALRRQVDDLMDAAATRPPISYVPSLDRRSQPPPSGAASALVLPPGHTAESVAAERAGTAAQQREALLRQAADMRRQNEAIDLAHACCVAQSLSAAAAERSQRNGELMAERASLKVATLQNGFKAKMAADGVDVLSSLEELGVEAADLDAVRRQTAGRQNKYLDTMDAARRAHELGLRAAQADTAR
jgi:hypothetical protein